MKGFKKITKTESLKTIFLKPIFFFFFEGRVGGWKVKMQMLLEQQFFFFTPCLFAFWDALLKNALLKKEKERI